MTRKQFNEKLTEKYNSLLLSEKTVKQFNNFKTLNESLHFLTEKQIRSVYKYRNKLMKDEELKEQYYVWHLLRTIKTKWNLIKTEIVVTQYYRNSKVINEIWRNE